MKRPFTFIRLVLTVAVLAATIAAFTYYFVQHPEIGRQLRQTSSSLLVLLLTLYLASVGALTLVTLATLRLCHVQLRSSEGLLVTMYTAIINFFGPLQSGPAFRAVYLKKKHDLKLKDYGVATLVYYFFYAGMSGMLLVSGILHWWLAALIPVGLLCGYCFTRNRRLAPRLQALDLQGWYLLALATFLQIVVVTAIYYAELRSVAPGVHLSQALVYTGAANLALFVSFTPGAIGFRESFLVFSQHLHHLSNNAIVAANIIDRAMYVVLLLILALFIFSTHAQRKLSVKP
jgi:uncharacterized membrane protein YbhN (UPF0104 family)